MIVGRAVRLWKPFRCSASILPITILCSRASWNRSCKFEKTFTFTGLATTAPFRGQVVYPRPYQRSLPIWLGVGGRWALFALAGTLGLPLMVAIIGGEPRRFRPLIDLLREAGLRAGHPLDQSKVGIHVPGYVADTIRKQRTNSSQVTPEPSPSLAGSGAGRRLRVVSSNHSFGRRVRCSLAILEPSATRSSRSVKHSEESRDLGSSPVAVPRR